jgi:16S rRNA (guanine527-N7)-methyltransferase
MEKAHIRELLAPFLGGNGLGEAQLGNISIYIDILLRWNARMNLTAVRERDEIITRHFGESFFLARHLFPAVSSARNESPFRAADLGSGAGFPGIPLKIWRTDLDVTLIESNQKKATFLREVIRALTLTNIDVFDGRAETLPVSSFDLVTMRAVERFEEAMSAAARLVATGGRIGLLIGEAQTLRLHALQPHFQWQDGVPVPQSRQRIVVIGKRESA